MYRELGKYQRRRDELYDVRRETRLGVTVLCC